MKATTSTHISTAKKANTSQTHLTLNREQIKYLAIAAMTCNHIAHTLVLDGIWHEVLTDIGYFTAITMCYLLVEGFHYTHSVKCYALRLCLFAVISQVPYYLAFHFSQLNMLFSLLFCLLLLQVRKWRHTLKIPASAAWSLTALLIFCCLFCDWNILSPVFTLLFARAWDKRGDSIRKSGTTFLSVREAFVLSAFFFWILNLSDCLSQYSLVQSLWLDLFATLPLLLACLILTRFYSGQRMHTGRIGAWINKWFFYIYYPAHLLVLAWLAGAV